MDPAHVLVWLKALLAAGFATWDDPPLGQGVVWRSIDSSAVHRAAYRLVIAVQALTAALLWWAAVLLLVALTGVVVVNLGV